MSLRQYQPDGARLAVEKAKLAGTLTRYPAACDVCRDWCDVALQPRGPHALDAAPW